MLSMTLILNKISMLLFTGFLALMTWMILTISVLNILQGPQSNQPLFLERAKRVFHAGSLECWTHMIIHEAWNPQCLIAVVAGAQWHCRQRAANGRQNQSKLTIGLSSFLPFVYIFPASLIFVSPRPRASLALPLLQLFIWICHGWTNRYKPPLINCIEWLYSECLYRARECKQSISSIATKKGMKLYTLKLPFLITGKEYWVIPSILEFNYKLFSAFTY